MPWVFKRRITILAIQLQSGFWVASFRGVRGVWYKRNAPPTTPHLHHCQNLCIQPLQDHDITPNYHKLPYRPPLHPAGYTNHAAGGPGGTVAGVAPWWDGVTYGGFLGVWGGGGGVGGRGCVWQCRHREALFMTVLRAGLAGLDSNFERPPVVAWKFLHRVIAAWTLSIAQPAQLQEQTAAQKQTPSQWQTASTYHQPALLHLKQRVSFIQRKSGGVPGKICLLFSTVQF